MKVVSFRMEEGEIEDLLKETRQTESSGALRHVIQEWKDLKLLGAEKGKTLASLQEEAKDLRKKLGEAAVELSETKEHTASSVKSLTTEKNKLAESLYASREENKRLQTDLYSKVDSERHARWKANEMRNYAVMFFSMFFVGAALSFILLVYLLAYHFDFRILVFAVFLSIFVMIVIGYFVKNYS